MQVGTLDALWRYPVKSLGGERLIRSRLDTAGLPGDRILCLRDEGNGEMLSAKRLPVMLGLQARYDEKSGGVMIVTTAGDLIDSADPFASALLGAQLGRVVSLLPLMEDDAHYRRRVPLNPDGVKRLLGLSLQDELPKADVPDEVRLVLRQYVTWPGSHFDVAPLHVVTRQSLEKLAGGSDDIARLERYRANLVLDCETLADWPEQAWIGHRLCIGDAVIAITQATVRCAMPRYGQPDLPDNPAVSSRLRDKTGHVLGVYARVIRGGMLECGAEVGVEPNLGERRYYDIPAFAQPGREASAPSPRGDRLWRVTEVIRESAEITSFWLKPEDGALLPFLPGQHVIVRMPGGGDSRVYSLSSGVADTACRISVRRDPSRDAGFTAMLVDRITVGDALRINGPMGSFAVHPADSSPLVLASVGVGITPFLSILRSAIALRPTRPIHLFHCTDTPAGFAFEGELRSALRLLPNLQIDVLAKAPRCSEERLAFSQARLDAVRLVSSPLFGAGARIMLCGSPGFVERLGGQLRAHGVADARWTSELFIPAGKAHFQAGSASAGSFGVKVNATLEGAWGDASNLLEWIEAAGYAAPNGCRYGACGACAARLVAGKVEYLPGVTAPTDPGTVLLCTARPASDIELETDIHPIAG